MSLHAAVQAGDVESAEQLIFAGADPNCGGDDATSTPLHLAVLLAGWDPMPGAQLVGHVSSWAVRLGAVMRDVLTPQCAFAPSLMSGLPSGSLGTFVATSARQHAGAVPPVGHEASPALADALATAPSAQQLLRAQGLDRQSVVGLLLSCAGEPCAPDASGITPLDLLFGRVVPRARLCGKHPLLWRHNPKACGQLLPLLTPHLCCATLLRVKVKPFSSRDWCYARLVISMRYPQPVSSAPPSATTPVSYELWLVECEPHARVLAVVPLDGAVVTTCSQAHVAVQIPVVGSNGAGPSAQHGTRWRRPTARPRRPPYSYNPSFMDPRCSDGADSVSAVPPTEVHPQGEAEHPDPPSHRCVRLALRPCSAVSMDPGSCRDFSRVVAFFAARPWETGQVWRGPTTPPPRAVSSTQRALQHLGWDDGALRGAAAQLEVSARYRGASFEGVRDANGALTVPDHLVLAVRGSGEADGDDQPMTVVEYWRLMWARWLAAREAAWDHAHPDGCPALRLPSRAEVLASRRCGDASVPPSGSGDVASVFVPTPSCVVCLDAVPILGLRHGPTVHACVCYACAGMLLVKHNQALARQRQGEGREEHSYNDAPMVAALTCPMCRQVVEAIVVAPASPTLPARERLM